MPITNIGRKYLAEFYKVSEDELWSGYHTMIKRDGNFVTVYVPTKDEDDEVENRRVRCTRSRS